MRKVLLMRLIPVLVIFIALGKHTQEEHDGLVAGDELRYALCVEGHHPKSVYLSAGFNYELVGRFNKLISENAEIVTAESSGDCLDLLCKDSLDIVITPYDRELSANSEFCCSPVLPDSTVWVVRRENERMLLSFTHWLGIFKKEKEYKTLIQRFSPSYDPYKRLSRGGTFRYVSPYDDLIRAYSEKIPWDWKLLAALIWQESRFMIDAHSRKGAEGLLQMLPSTAKRFKNEDMLDPEKNLASGVRYLQTLQKIFSPHADEKDLPKFVLAAYSSGEGRVLDCIRYAKSHNLPYSSWKDMEKLITVLREDPQAKSDSTLQYGGLRGNETLDYVSKVYSIYDAFSLISSGSSVQDQP